MLLCNNNQILNLAIALLIKIRDGMQFSLKTNRLIQIQINSETLSPKPQPRVQLLHSKKNDKHSALPFVVNGASYIS